MPVTFQFGKYASVVVVAAVASTVVGGFAGGLVGLAVGGVGALATLAPYLGTRLKKRRDAAYLFVAAHRPRK